MTTISFFQITITFHNDDGLVAYVSSRFTISVDDFLIVRGTISSNGNGKERLIVGIVFCLVIGSS